jgi:hypothetical protein
MNELEQKVQTSIALIIGQQVIQIASLQAQIELLQPKPVEKKEGEENEPRT